MNLQPFRFEMIDDTGANIRNNFLIMTTNKEIVYVLCVRHGRLAEADSS